MFHTVRSALAETFPSFFSPPPVAQMAALCYRDGLNGVEVLLITSSNGRWILPKGWPIDGLNGGETAMQEAWEEAGVKRGEVTPVPLGRFMTVKHYNNGDEADCETTVYAIKVQDMSSNFPEVAKRERRWVSLAEAADVVDEPGLRGILEAFDAN